MKPLILLFTFITLLSSIVHSQSVDWSANQFTGVACVESGNSILTKSNTVQKRDPNGNVIYTQTITPSGTFGIQGVTGNLNGDYVIYGQFNGTVDFDLSSGVFNLTSHNDYCHFYAKYDVSGNLQFVNQFATLAGGQLNLTKADLLDNGRLILNGEFQGNMTHYAAENTANYTQTSHLGERNSVFFVSGTGALGNGYLMNHIETTSNIDVFSGGVAVDPSSGEIGVAVNLFTNQLGGISTSDFVKMNETNYVQLTLVTNSFVFHPNMVHQTISLLPAYDKIDYINDIAYDTEGFLHVIGVSNAGGATITAWGENITVPHQGNVGDPDAIWAMVSPDVLATGTPTNKSAFVKIHTYGSTDWDAGYFGESLYFPSRIKINGTTAHISRFFNATVDFLPGQASPSQVAYGNGEFTIHSFGFDNLNPSLPTTLENLFTIGSLDEDILKDFDFDASNNLFVSIQNGTGAAIDIDPYPITRNIPGRGVVKYDNYGSTIVGWVYSDDNGNGLPDSGEIPVSNVSVRINLGSTTAGFNVTTDANGMYQAHVPQFPYSVGVDLSASNYYATATPLTQSVIVNQPSIIYYLDSIGLQYEPGIIDFQVLLQPLTPIRPGFEVLYSVFVKNKGTVAGIPTVSFDFDPQLTFNYAEGSPVYSALSSNLTWSLGNFNPLQDTSFIISFTAPVNIGLGVPIEQSVSVEPVLTDVYPPDNSMVLNQMTQGSYDPNDKQVFPEIITQEFADEENYLNYLVRFQNTGTDTAFTVIVRDTLDTQVYSRTLEILDVSHALVPTLYFDDITERQIVEFKFPNINLVDSTTNEEGSHGYFSYRIKIKSDFVDTVYNTADIYFDYNEPVITNTTKTYIDLSAGLEHEIKMIDLILYPNPTTDKIKVQFENEWIGTVNVVDVNGQTLMTLRGENSNSLILSLGHLNSGIYFINFINENGVMSQKIQVTK